jgi:hypothetical protein
MSFLVSAGGASGAGLIEEMKNFLMESSIVPFLAEWPVGSRARE